jgi:hypothetical protein
MDTKVDTRDLLKRHRKARAAVLRPVDVKARLPNNEVQFSVWASQINPMLVKNRLKIHEQRILASHTRVVASFILIVTSLGTCGPSTRMRSFVFMSVRCPPPHIHIHVHAHICTQSALLRFYRAAGFLQRCTCLPSPFASIASRARTCTCIHAIMHIYVQNVVQTHERGY